MFFVFFCAPPDCLRSYTGVKLLYLAFSVFRLHTFIGPQQVISFIQNVVCMRYASSLLPPPPLTVIPPVTPYCRACVTTYKVTDDTTPTSRFIMSRSTRSAAPLSLIHTSEVFARCAKSVMGASGGVVHGLRQGEGRARWKLTTHKTLY